MGRELLTTATAGAIAVVAASLACGAFDSDAPPAATDAGSASSSASSGGASSGASGGEDGGPETGGGCGSADTLVCADFANTTSLVQGGFERVAGESGILAIEPFQAEPNNPRLHVRVPKAAAGNRVGYLKRTVPDSPTSVLISARLRNGTDTVDDTLNLLAFEADNFRLVVGTSAAQKLTVSAGSPSATKQYQVVEFTAAQERVLEITLVFGKTNTIAVKVDGVVGAPANIDDFPSGSPAGGVSFGAGARSLVGSGGAWLDDVKLVVTQ